MKACSWFAKRLPQRQTYAVGVGTQKTLIYSLIAILFTFQAGAIEKITVFNPENLAELLAPLRRSSLPQEVTTPTGAIEQILEPSLIKAALAKLPPEQQENPETDNHIKTDAQVEVLSAPDAKDESSSAEELAIADANEVKVRLLARPLMVNKGQEQLLQSSLLPQFLHREGGVSGSRTSLMGILGGILPVSKTPPKFFVSSIIWVDEGLWSLWLNDQKLNATNQVANSDAGDVRVASISYNSVTFKWQPDSLIRIAPNWRSLLHPKASDASAFVSKDDLATYDRSTNVLEFTLKPNQTFDVANMRVVEGRKE